MSKGGCKFRYYRIHPNRIHIISYPGPDACIKMETLQNGNIVFRRYLNRQIGNILKELKLTEGKCTGIPTILKAMKNNGSPKPLFETDELRQSLSVTFLVHPAFEKINFDDLSLTPTAQRILEICVGEQLAASEIAKRLRVQVNSGSFRKAISQLLNEGLITYTLPGTPKSRLQQYTLTNKGEQYFGKEDDNVPF